MKRVKHIPIYVIFKYEENEFPTPEVFFKKREYNARFKALANTLKECEDGEVYIDNECHEASLLSLDTLYQGFEVKIPATSEELYLYFEMENDKYFRATGTDASPDQKRVQGWYVNSLMRYHEKAVAHYYHISEYITTFSVDNNPYGNKYCFNFYTEGGAHGSEQHSAMVCKVQLNK